MLAKNTDDKEMKQKLGRTIWRARRKAKRQRTQRDLEDACRNKRCPQLARRSMHFNWSKTFGPIGDASKQLFDYYSGVYELAPEHREKEETTKAKCVAEWRRDFETGTQPLRISAEILRTIIRKLKPGKGSSDGITAEILRELDESNLEAMAAALNNLFRAQRTSTNLERDHSHIGPKAGSPVRTQRLQTNRSFGHSPKASGLSVPALRPDTFLVNISVWVRLRPRRSSISLLRQEAGRSGKRVEATLVHSTAGHVEGL